MLPLHRNGQTEIVTQRRSFVVTAENTSILQQRHHVVDELVEAGRHKVRPEDEPIRTVVADKRIYFLGNLLRCTDDRSTLELIDHHFAQIQLLALRYRAQFCDGRETILVNEGAALDDRRSLGIRSDIG